MEEQKFGFENGQRVKLMKSGEMGEVIAVADYARRPPLYLVEYVSAHGCQCENWFDEEALLEG